LFTADENYDLDSIVMAELDRSFNYRSPQEPFDGVMIRPMEDHIDVDSIDMSPKTNNPSCSNG
jgi:hypothetical protein